jgi:hypothetical protein
MKTAGRENQERYKSLVASRDQGTEGQNNPAQWGGLEGKKTCGHQGRFLFLTTFIGLIRNWAQSFAANEHHLRG